VSIHRIKVRNFRLLADIELVLEDEATLIVGRNNSGKTSLAELLRRFFDGDANPVFHIEDFSTACYDAFCAALKAKNDGVEEEEFRHLIPAIELRVYFHYDPATAEFGGVSEFVVDLDPDCNEALVVARYELKDGAIKAFFDGQPTTELTTATRIEFFRAVRERIPVLFTTKLWAEDPNDPSNRKPVTVNAVRSFLKVGFINAQRGLDDITTRETDVLAKILQNLFASATSPNADAAERTIAESLQDAVLGIQQKIEQDFSSKLKGLLPTFRQFGYPGLNGPELQTETTLARIIHEHEDAEALFCYKRVV
jgi:energy-coupling factor transporter ATP-binding protein EcfA2